MSTEENTTEQSDGDVKEGSVGNKENDSSSSQELCSGLGAGGLDSSRGDIKASTIARMMGLMTVGDLKLMESKVDLMAAKVNNIAVRLEKVTAAIGGVSQGSDLDRVEAQLASMRTLLKEFMGVNAENTSGSEGGKNRRDRAIVSSASETVKEKAEVVLSEKENTNGASSESEAPDAEQEASTQEA